MAKTSMVERNKKRQKLVSQYRDKLTTLREERRKKFISGEDPWDIQEKIQSIPRNANPTRVQRRCFVCGRTHAVFRKFRLCRLCLRKLGMQGLIAGLVKSSW